MLQPDAPRPSRSRRQVSRRLILSYAFDWLVLIVIGVAGYVLGNLEPNRRPFSLEDHEISFPFTIHETVPASVAFLVNSVGPLIVILIVTLVFVPRSSVRKGTPTSMIWRRKLWELHIGWLGLGLSVALAWFITSAMKNMFGKPRPDLLSRCDPDLENVGQYIVGGVASRSGNGQLVSASICKSTDIPKLRDGFRSFPSGHSSSSSAGLIYLSLFFASKFAVAIPSCGHLGYRNVYASAAFPSRLRMSGEAYQRIHPIFDDEMMSLAPDVAVPRNGLPHDQGVRVARREFAAPPIYLLAITAFPVFLAVFIAGNRWFDFRHHGFDIVFGFMIGVITAAIAFRYYHLPICGGAGWGWGPRSPSKAFWAGVGSRSYATDGETWEDRGDEEMALDTINGETTNLPSEVPSSTREEGG